MPHSPIRLGHTVRYAGAVCLLMQLAVRLPADTPGQARKAIEAAYARHSAAANKKDVNAFFSVMTDDYVKTDLRGKTYTRSQTLEGMKQSLMYARAVHGSIKLTKFSMSGDTATAFITHHLDITVVDPRTSKTASMVADGTAQETWKKTSKGWMISKSKSLTNRATIDGKPVPNA